MAILKIEQSEWRTCFDAISKALAGKRAEIELDALSIGSQVEAEWLPLLGISYDARSEVIEIALEGLDHRMYKPREVYVDREGISLSSLEIIDDQDARQIIRLRDPLMLPLFMEGESPRVT